MSISKTICIKASSNLSFDDAVKVALLEASRSIDYITKLKVTSMECLVSDNKIYEFIVGVDICFDVDTERKSK